MRNGKPNNLLEFVLVYLFITLTYPVRAREEQRERERDAADEAAAKATQKEAGGGLGATGSESSGPQDEAKQAKVDAIRAKILDAALNHVPQQGWTRQAIVLGAEESGYPSVVHGMFPEGGFALVSHFNGKCNAQLVESLQKKTDGGKQEVEDPLDFLVQAVRQRLEMVTPYKTHWPQAMALIAQPQHAPTALAQVLTLVDDICYYSGDRSVDVCIVKFVLVFIVMVHPPLVRLVYEARGSGHHHEDDRAVLPARHLSRSCSDVGFSQEPNGRGRAATNDAIPDRGHDTHVPTFL